MQKRYDSLEEENYWNLAYLTVSKIFGQKDQYKLEKLEREVVEIDAVKKSFFYHIQPLNMVSELYGLKASDSQIEQYVKLKNKILNKLEDQSSGHHDHQINMNQNDSERDDIGDNQMNSGHKVMIRKSSLRI